MENSLQLPYPFSALNLASMFELSSLTSQNSQGMHGDNNNPVNNNHNNNNNKCRGSPPKSPNSQQNIDAATAMSRFLFPPTIIAQGFCHIAPNEEMSRDKFLKRGVSSKSFTIDSLLGLNNAARAVIQGGMVPSSHHHNHHHHHQHSHLGALNEINLSSTVTNWRVDQRKLENKKENRYHPFTTSHGQAQTDSRSKHAASSNPSAGQEKSQESSPQSIRRAAKAKRVRTIFTPEQLERLEAEFERQQYMVGPERLYLASSLHLTEAQVKVWFQNRRIKWRKQHLEMQQQRLAAIRSQQHDMDDDESSDFGGSSSPTPTVASSGMTETTSVPLPFSASSVLRRNTTGQRLQSAQTPPSNEMSDHEIRDSCDSSPRTLTALPGLIVSRAESIDFQQPNQ